MTRKDYRIYRTCEADFDRAAAELADRAAADGGTILRIVFFGYATDNDDHIARRDTARRICAERFGAEGPLVGFIAQKPLRSSRTFTSADIRRRTSSNCLLAVMSPTVASQSSLLW